MTTKEGMYFDGDGWDDYLRFPKEDDIKNMLNLRVGLWTSTVEDLDSMDRITWKLTTALKSVLNSHPIAVFWHESINEQCCITDCTNPGLHMHILTDGFKHLNNCDNYKALATAIDFHAGLMDTSDLSLLHKEHRDETVKKLLSSCIYAGCNTRAMQRFLQQMGTEITGKEFSLGTANKIQHGLEFDNYNNPVIKMMNEKRNWTIVDMIIEGQSSASGDDQEGSAHKKPRLDGDTSN